MLLDAEIEFTKSLYDFVIKAGNGEIEDLTPLAAGLRELQERLSLSQDLIVIPATDDFIMLTIPTDEDGCPMLDMQSVMNFAADIKHTVNCAGVAIKTDRLGLETMTLDELKKYRDYINQQIGEKEV